MWKRRVFDKAFKRMAVELSHAKGSVQEAARELGIDSGRITKWRQSHKSPGQFATAATGLSEEQKLIKRLQKELKAAQLDRTAEAARYIKKAVGIFSRVHAQSELRYGNPRIADELRERGVKVSRNRVARLMNKAAIRSSMYNKYRVQTTDSTHDFPVAKNLLNRECAAEKPGQKWVSDRTYIPTGEGWLYLTIVLDLADRKVIGWP